MNYVCLDLRDTEYGVFSIVVTYDAINAPLAAYTCTYAQLQRLYALLQPYYLGSSLYLYRNIDAYIELLMCENINDVLTLLSWRNN